MAVFSRLRRNGCTHELFRRGTSIRGRSLRAAERIALLHAARAVQVRLTVPRAPAPPPSLLTRWHRYDAADRAAQNHAASKGRQFQGRYSIDGEGREGVRE